MTVDYRDDFRDDQDQMELVGDELEAVADAGRKDQVVTAPLVTFGEFAAGWTPGDSAVHRVVATPIEGHLKAGMREAWLCGDLDAADPKVAFAATWGAIWMLHFCEAASAAAMDPEDFAVDGVVAGGDPFDGPEEPPE